MTLSKQFGIAILINRKMFFISFPAFVLFLAIFFAGCTTDVFVYPEQEVSLFSDLPSARADTVHEMAPGLGYGAVFCQENGFISYPALYLSNDDALTGESVVLLGFTALSDEKTKSNYTLELAVNYAQRQLTNLEVYLYPIMKPWKAEEITYNQFFSGEYIKEDLFARYYFRLEAVRLPEKIRKLPFEDVPQVLEFNLMPIQNELKYWYGVAVIFASAGNCNYITSGKGNIVCSTGSVELIPSCWQEWNGYPDARFTVLDGCWLPVKNRLYHTGKYCPQIRIEHLR